MQRKATATTRGPNSAELKFRAWCKEHSCIVCGNPGPSIVHHAEGATFKHDKVLCGHWFLLPLCQPCDRVVTNEGKPAFRRATGTTQASLWFELVSKSPHQPPEDVQNAIADRGR